MINFFKLIGSSLIAALLVILVIAAMIAGVVLVPVILVAGTILLIGAIIYDGWSSKPDQPSVDKDRII